MIKINTVALTESAIENSKVDDYSEYLFAFSVNGTFLVGSGVVIVNIFNIQIDSLVRGGVAFLIPLITSFSLAVLKYYQEDKRRQRNRKRRREMSERIREQMLEEISTGFEELREVESRKKELEIFHELADTVEHARNEFTNAGELEPVAEELEDSEKIPDDIVEILRDKLDETQENLRDEEPEEERLMEKREQLQEEYEGLLSDESALKQK